MVVAPSAGANAALQMQRVDLGMAARMSALGQEPTFGPALPQVRSPPDSGHRGRHIERLLNQHKQVLTSRATLTNRPECYFSVVAKESSSTVVSFAKILISG
jgi:hypothetical protein